jgi:CheY-like chemotaxis protein
MTTANKPRILITEDDYENQKFLKLLLRREFEVEICDSDTTFYEKIHGAKFDIILMDISLRGNKTGLELTRELKSNPEYKEIPIVCLTAHVFKKDRQNALDAGIDVFLTKPIDNKVLINTLLENINKNTERK